jgi:hypothetical protein
MVSIRSSFPVRARGIAALLAVAFATGCVTDDGTPVARADAGPSATGDAPSAAAPAQAPAPAAMNLAPTISGTPSVGGSAGSPYEFEPVAADANGDRLVFSATNLPAWATLDPSTGRVTGTPTLAHAGSWPGIVVTVSDGRSSASLPSFGITVDPPAANIGAVTLTWTAPTLSADGRTPAQLAGYRIYFGQVAEALTSSIAVANPGLTSYVVDGLANGTYYFAVTALSTEGAESTPSAVGSTVIL